MLVLALHQTLSLPDPVLWVIAGLIVAWAGMLLRLWALLTLFLWLKKWNVEVVAPGEPTERIFPPFVAAS